MAAVATAQGVHGICVIPAVPLRGVSQGERKAEAQTDTCMSVFTQSKGKWPSAGVCTDKMGALSVYNEVLSDLKKTGDLETCCVNEL